MCVKTDGYVIMEGTVEELTKQQDMRHIANSECVMAQEKCVKAKLARDEAAIGPQCEECQHVR